MLCCFDRFILEPSSDGRRGGDGSATGLVRAYFDTVGWPTIVNEAERKPFAMQVNRRCKPPDFIRLTIVNNITAVGN
jgi:hypothetical protein